MEWYVLIRLDCGEDHPIEDCHRASYYATKAESRRKAMAKFKEKQSWIWYLNIPHVVKSFSKAFPTIPINEAREYIAWRDIDSN